MKRVAMILAIGAEILSTMGLSLNANAADIICKDNTVVHVDCIAKSGKYLCNSSKQTCVNIKEVADNSVRQSDYCKNQNNSNAAVNSQPNYPNSGGGVNSSNNFNGGWDDLLKAQMTVLEYQRNLAKARMLEKDAH
ncbi:MAG: hypothetical protein HQK95_08545 [Nitrospirae bacterium]|nr:hypothetical protein [Nitrospirota bacterium]